MVLCIISYTLHTSDKTINGKAGQRKKLSDAAYKHKMWSRKRERVGE